MHDNGDRITDEALHVWINESSLTSAEAQLVVAGENATIEHHVDVQERSIVLKGAVKAADVAFSAIEWCFTKANDRRDRKNGELPHYGSSNL